MRLQSLLIIFNLIAILSVVSLVGCESVDVDPDHIAASGGGVSGDTPGGENVKTISVNPASGQHTTTGDYTVLEVAPISGYTFTWALSDAALGNIGTKTGNKTVYTTTSIPPTGSKVQIITVIGRNPNTSTTYRGTSRITHGTASSGGNTPPGGGPPTP